MRAFVILLAFMATTSTAMMLLHSQAKPNFERRHWPIRIRETEDGNPGAQDTGPADFGAQEPNDSNNDEQDAGAADKSKKGKGQPSSNKKVPKKGNSNIPPTSPPSSNPDASPSPSPDAGPSPAPAPAPAPGVGKASSACTFTTASAAIAGKHSCKDIVLSGITVPGGTTLDLTALNDGTSVTFQGITTWEYKAWGGFLLAISGNHLTVRGAPGAVLDGQGPKYWGGKGSSNPKLLFVSKTTNSYFSNLYIKNAPFIGLMIRTTSNTQFINITVDDADGAKFNAKNTDGIQVGDSTSVYISGANVTNQDDCIAVLSGTNITFTRGLCDKGHGITTGAVGVQGDASKNVVSNVLFSHSTVTNSMNGIRVKSYSNAQGSVDSVTYDDISLINITDYAIAVEQDYNGKGPTGRPGDGVSISGLHLNNIHGTTSNGKTKDLYIMCGNGSCKNWTFNDVTIHGGVTGTCKNQPADIVC